MNTVWCWARLGRAMAHYCLSVVAIFYCSSRKNWVIESVINRVAVKLSLGMPLPPEKKLALLASWPDFEDSTQETNKLFSCRIAATWWSGAWTRGFGRGSRFWRVWNFGKWRSTGRRRGRFWQYWCNVTVVIFLPWSWKLGLNAWPKNLETISTLYTGKILIKW